MEPASDLSAETCAFQAYLRRPTRRRLARVVRIFHERVWRLALRSAGNEEDAADITQDIFLSLLINPPKHGAVRSPRGYLAYRVLTLAVRVERGRQRRRRRETLAARQIATRSAVSAADEEALQAAIRTLPERVRTALELRYFAGLRNGEVAEALGVSERTVEDELRHGREALRQRLGAGALGALAILDRGPGEAPAAPPPDLLVDLLGIVRSGTAIIPRSTALPVGTTLLKKACVVVLALLVVSTLGWWGSTVFERPSKPSSPVPDVSIKGPGPGTHALEGARSKTPVDGVETETAPSSQPAEKREAGVTIAGWVVDERGEVAAGARVGVYHGPSSLHSRGEAGFLVEATTDERGEFLVTVERAPRGAGLTLVAEKTGFARGWARPSVLLPGDEKPASIEGVLVVLPQFAADLQGTILDDAGRPIEAATVRASVKANPLGAHFMRDTITTGPGLAATDRNGFFRIEGLPASSPVDIFAEHADHLPRLVRHVIAGGPPLEVRLERGVFVEGRVVGPDGKPVPGAAVNIEEDLPYRFDFSAPHVHPVRTDEDGKFLLRGVPPRPCKLSVSPPVEYLEPEPERLRLTAPVTGHVVSLEAGAWIDGIAREHPSQTPLPNAPVLIRFGERVRNLRTARNGSFRCAVVPGPIVVQAVDASDSEHGPKEDGDFQGEVEANETLRGVTVLFIRKELLRPEDLQSAALVQGTVVDPQGRPVVAAVALCRELHAGARGFTMTYREAYTGPDGRFVLEYARFPTRLVAAVPSRLLRAEVVLDAPSGADLEVRLEPYDVARVEGFVVSPDGSPLPGAGVIVSRHSNDMLVGVAAVRADGEGRFRLSSLLPETYYSFTPVIGAVHGLSTAGVVRPGMTLEPRLTMPMADASVAGTVKDNRGQPIGGLRVSFDFEDDDLPRPESVTTRGDGTFRASGLLPGKYQLFVDERGYGLWAREVHTPDPPLEIELVANRIIRFALSEGSGLPVTAVRVSGEKTRAHLLRSASGRYAAEVLETETRLTIQRTSGEEQPRIDVNIAWPADGDLDLGELEFESRSKD